MGLSGDHGRLIKWHQPDNFALVERSRTMKAPVGLLSDRTVCESRWRGFAPTSSSLPYSVPAGFGADALQQEHYRSPTNVRTLTPNSNDQRQGIIMAMASCLLCYIRLFFHGRVWYTRLGSINRNLKGENSCIR